MHQSFVVWINSIPCCSAVFPDSRSPSVTKDQHDEVDLDGSGTFNQDPAPSNNNNAGPLPPVPQQQPTQPGSSTCQYSGSFTLSRFPWSRACVKREEQIKLWSDYTNQHQQGNTNCRSRIVHSTVSSHIGKVGNNSSNHKLLTCNYRPIPIERLLCVQGASTASTCS